MHTPRRSGLLAVCGLVASLAPSLAAQDAQELPITSITLYRSGVGSFVRRGEVEGTRAVELRFRTDQVNDILKSMVVMDLSGGRVDGAMYESKEPLERRLSSFAVDISDNPDRGQLLNRLRGTRISVKTAEGETAGTVLGVETEVLPGADGREGRRRQTLSLVTETGLWSADLDSVRSFNILDEDMARELTRALAAVAEHRADNVKGVRLGFRGDGVRDVVVGYVHEAPVWKTSYRLVLPDDASLATGAQAKPVMQGWAIVENTTDEDWTDVSLSLVAGQPVGFTMDLYEPLFMERPELPVPTAAGVRPRGYAEGQSTILADAAIAGAFDASNAPLRGMESKALREEAERNPAPASAPFGGGESLGFAMDKGFSSGDMLRSAAFAAAQAQEVGEVFQYTLDHPISVGRQQSAMLPILSSPIEGRRVSIFSPGDSANPMRGVELTNDSGLQLMAGPIAVFDGVAYAGDAQLGHVPEGGKRLLAYAADLDVSVITEHASDSAVQRVRIVRGLVEQSMRQAQKTTYKIESSDEARGRTLIIEHPRLEGWELVETPKPVEETQALHRFELDIKPGGSTTLGVTQQFTHSESYELLGYDLSSLQIHARQGKASDKVVEAFREAARRQGLVFDQERILAQLQQERDEIAQDQARIRENMRSIDRNSDLYSTYVKKFTEQETRLEAIHDESDRAQSERDTRQRELQEYLAGLNVE